MGNITPKKKVKIKKLENIFSEFKMLVDQDTIRIVEDLLQRKLLNPDPEESGLTEQPITSLPQTKNKKVIDGQQQSKRQDCTLEAGDLTVRREGVQQENARLKREPDETQYYIYKLEAKIQTLQEEKQLYNEEIKKEKDFRKAIESKYEKLKRQLVDLQAEKQRRQNQFAAQVTVQEEKQRHYERMTKVVAECQEESRRDFEKDIGSVLQDTRKFGLTRANTKLQWDYEKLTTVSELQQAKTHELDIQSRKLESLQRENETITEQLENIQQEKQHNDDQLRAKIAELQQEKKDHENLRRCLAEIRAEYMIKEKTLTRQIRDLESSKIQELETSEESRKRELGEKERELNSYCNENDKLLTDLGEVRSQYQDMQNDLNGQIDKLQGENKSMASSMVELERDKEELVQHLDKKDKALKDAKTRVDILLKKTTYLEREKQNLNESLTDQIGKLIEEKHRMAVSITDLRKYRENLEKQFDNSEDKLKIAQSNKAKLTEELEILQQEYQTTRKDLEKHIVSLKGDKSELSSTIEKLHQNVAMKERQIGDTEDQLKTMKLNKDKLEQEMDILRQEYQTYRSEREKQIVLLIGDKSALSSRVENLQQNFAKMEIQLGASEDKLKTVQSDKDKLTEELEALQEEYQTTRADLRAQIVSLREDNSSLSSTVEKLQQNVLGLKTQCGSLLRTLDAVNMEKEAVEKEMDILQKEKQKQHQDMFTKLEDVRTTCLTLSSKNDALEEKLGSLQATLHTVSMEKEVSEKEVASLQERLTDISTKMKDLTAANSTLISNNDDLKQEKELLQEQFDAKVKEFQTLHREMKEAAERAKRKSVVLSLRSEGSGMGKAMVDMVTRELKRGLEGKVDKTNIDLTIQPYQESAADLCGPLVFLFFNMSMTSIPPILKGVKTTKDVVVLLLHHTSKGNLSSLTPTSLRMTGSEFRQFGGVIDMSFSRDSGLYECDLNTIAMEKLAVILKKY